MLRQFCRKNRALNICVPTTLILAAIGAVTFSAMMVGAGYYLGVRQQAASPPETDEMRVAAENTAAIRAWIEQERGQLEQVRAETEDHLDALAIRLARLQAEMMRVGAVGERLVGLAELDSREFDFSQPPAVGGPDDPEVEKTQSASDLIAGMSLIEKTLHERGEQLNVLEEWLMTNEVRRQTLPSGLPVFGGWVSSDFGSRINPVTGKRHLHTGVDIPGDHGEDVLAVAAGVVTRSERMNGYGNLVEIRHADGYTTRYAHNDANLVKEGDRVVGVERVLKTDDESEGGEISAAIEEEGGQEAPDPSLEDDGEKPGTEENTEETKKKESTN